MGLDLAVHLGIQFIDLDQDIEKDTKRSVKEIFSEEGEAHFRQLEKFHLEKIIAERDSFVLATGGGTPAFFNNLKIMQASGKTVFINTPVEVIGERLKNDSSRPLMKSNSLEDLYSKRKSWYTQADYTINQYQELLDLFN